VIAAERHTRTERRDKWLHGASPKRRCPELSALLATARAIASADPQRRAGALGALEKAAIAWASPPLARPT